MPLHLITGRANAGKTGLLYGPLIEAAKRGRRPALLLPSAPEARRAIAEFTDREILGIEVLTLDSWIAELWARYGDGRAVVGDVARRVHMARAVGAAHLEALRRSTNHAGFVQLLCELSRRAGVAPRAVDGSPEARELAAVLGDYNSRLESAGLVELAHAARCLAAEEIGSYGPVAVSRFTDFSEPQERFVVALGRSCEVFVGLTWEEGLPATEALDALVARLAGVAEDHAVVAEHAGGDPELQLLGERLFQPGAAAISATGAVELGEASGVEAESAVCARVVLRLMNEGFPADRIAVGFRDVTSRASLLQAAFTAQGIEVRIDAAAPFSATPYGSAALGLLRVTSMAMGGPDGQARERLVAFLLSPYSGADADAVARLDRSWRLGGVREPRRLLRDAERCSDATAACVGAARRALSARVDADLRVAWQELAVSLLRNGMQRHALGSERSRADAAAHAAFLRTIDEAISAETMGDVFAVISALEGVSVHGDSERSEGGVLITEAHRLRSLRFDALVLGGLSSSEFSAEKPEPLVARVAPRLGIEAGTDERLSERMLFYSVVTRARKRLVLVRQSASASGEPIRASAFWDELLDLYRDPQDVEEQADVVPTGMRVERVSLADVAAAAPSYAVGRAEVRRAAAREGGPRGPRRGLDSDMAALKQLAQRRTFRVTELETYAACPYRWFQAYVLGTRGIDPQLDAAARGSYAHDALAAFYRDDFPVLGVDRMTADVLPEALARLSRLFARVRQESGFRPTGIAEELDLARAESWVRQVLVDDQEYLPGFTPVAFELRFGDDEPFVFGDVQVFGRMDRIDVGPGGVVITDYKSASDVKGSATFGTWRLLQLPVYAVAAATAFGHPIAGGLYRSIKTLRSRGFYDASGCEVPLHGSDRDATDASGIDEIVDSAKALAAAAADGIRSGRIDPDPQTSDACKYCGAAAFCSKARVSVW